MLAAIRDNVTTNVNAIMCSVEEQEFLGNLTDVTSQVVDGE
jgi:hypothetical protein